MVASVRRWGRLAAVAAVTLAVQAGAGDWTFYRHDLSGTSNAGEPLTVDQARAFTVKWTAHAGGAIGNPVVAGGTVFVTGIDGSLHAFDAATGAERWRKSSYAYGPFHCFPNSTSSSTKGPIGAPAVVGSTVFMPGGNGIVYAHDVATGAIRWQRQIADVPNLGEFLWSSIFPLNGRLYVGIASLHDCLLVPGKVVALDQATGAITGTWWADPNHGPGGGVWTQPAYDPRTNRIFFTTGTIAQGLTPSQQPLADAFVAADPVTMQTVDHFTPVDGDYYADVDFGAGPLLYDTADGRHWIVAANKNGWVYALDRDHLANGVAWAYQVSGYYGDPDAGLSTIVSAAYANGTVFVGGTKTPDNFSGALAALDPATGRPKWVIHPPNGGFLLAPPIVTGDVVIFVSTQTIFASSGHVLYVVDQATGAIAYQYALPGALFAQPTYANGTLYVGDLAGNLWAFAPGGGGGGGGTGTLFTDDFTRTTGLGSAWSVAHGAFSTNGSVALGTAAQSYAAWTGSPPADVTVSANVQRPTASSYVGVIARATASAPDSDHYAGFVLPDGSLGIARRNAWSYTYLALGSSIGTGVHALSLQAVGTGPVALTLLVDGVPALTATDSGTGAITVAGRAGMFDYNGASQPIDHFVVVGGSSGGGGGGGGGGTATFTDDFNRTGALGSSWGVAHGAFSANGTAAVGTAAQSYAFWTGTPDPNAPISATVRPPTASSYYGVFARATPSQPDADHYVAFVGPDGRVALSRRNGWAYTSLASGSVLPAGAHVLTLAPSGASPVVLSVKVDGTEVIHFTDSSASALTAGGKAGIFDYNGAAQPLDDFTVGTATTASPVVVAADDFTYSGTLSPDWTVWSGGFSVSGGAAASTSQLSYATRGRPVLGDVAVSASVDPQGQPYAGVLARANPFDAIESHYAAWFDPDGSVHLARANGWIYTYLASATPQTTGAHQLQLVVSGTGPVHLSILVDGNPILDFTDDAPGAIGAPGSTGVFSWQGAGPTYQHFVAMQP